MVPFKFFKGKVYTDEYTIPNEPPFGISRRHWNILPEDLRGGESRLMEVYIEGWEARRNNITTNPYLGINYFQVIEWCEMWNRGFWECGNRLNPPNV
jgi:hypothetical protein